MVAGITFDGSEGMAYGMPTKARKGKAAATQTKMYAAIVD